MDKSVREILFEPLRKNVLSAIIPDFTFSAGDKEIAAPAQLVRHHDEFRFTLHFNSGTPPRELQSARGGFSARTTKRRSMGRSTEKLVSVAMMFSHHRR